MQITVSTHSRLKAAGIVGIRHAQEVSFNTQPPEGGWTVDLVVMLAVRVSTHSRLKAAGPIIR